MNFYILAISVLTLFNACESNKKDESGKYTLFKRHILPEKVQETSGLIKYSGLVWTFNDSGGKPEIYGLNLMKDSIEQTILLDGAINKDWEEIAQDEANIYLGDFGNNQGTRDSLVIYKISKSGIPPKGDGKVNTEKIVFNYPGYIPASIPVGWSAFDCEAFVVIKDSLYLFTKDWTNGSTTIYSLPKNAGKYSAKKIKSLNPKGLITGADYQNNKLLLIGYSNFVPFILQFNSSNLNTITDKEGNRFDLTDLATYQTEGICFDGKTILISSEKTRSPAQIIELGLN